MKPQEKMLQNKLHVLLLPVLEIIILIKHLHLGDLSAFGDALRLLHIFPIKRVWQNWPPVRLMHHIMTQKLIQSLSNVFLIANLLHLIYKQVRCQSA